MEPIHCKARVVGKRLQKGVLLCGVVDGVEGLFGYGRFDAWEAELIVTPGRRLYPQRPLRGLLEASMRLSDPSFFRGEEATLETSFEPGTGLTHGDLAYLAQKYRLRQGK